GAGRVAVVVVATVGVGAAREAVDALRGADAGRAALFGCDRTATAVAAGRAGRAWAGARPPASARGGGPGAAPPPRSAALGRRPWVGGLAGKGGPRARAGRGDGGPPGAGAPTGGQRASSAGPAGERAGAPSASAPRASRGRARAPPRPRRAAPSPFAAAGRT